MDFICIKFLDKLSEKQKKYVRKISHIGFLDKQCIVKIPPIPHTYEFIFTNSSGYIFIEDFANKREYLKLIRNKKNNYKYSDKYRIINEDLIRTIFFYSELSDIKIYYETYSLGKNDNYGNLNLYEIKKIHKKTLFSYKKSYLIKRN